MNVLQNLMELYNQLPLDSTYRIVAKGILENLDKVSDATIYDIAELTNSSRTTVWRMVQKMGYHTYTDFRYALKSAVSQYTYYNRMLPEQDSQYEDDIIPAFLTRLRKSYEFMEGKLKYEKIDKIVEELNQAERISFYMPFRIYSIYSLQQNLAMTGKKTGYFCLLPDMLEDTKTLDSNSLIFINTLEFAETMDMSDVFLTAKSKGSKIILCNTYKSRYQSYADELLFDFELNSNSDHASNIMFEIFILVLSETYRVRYIK
jgi:DNA-binding MurR/RpiR family transcriptional regulator